MKSKKDHRTLAQAMQQAVEADIARDQLRIMAVAHPDNQDIAMLVYGATERALDAYRILVHRIVGMDEWKSLLASDRGGKPKPDRPKKYPKLAAYVKSQGLRPPETILGRLERMTSSQRRTAIGNTTIPSLSAIKRAKN